MHPLVRSAVYEQLFPGVRSQAHARAARLLIGAGADPELVAAQLLACEPAGDADAVQGPSGRGSGSFETGHPGNRGHLYATRTGRTTVRARPCCGAS